MREWYVMRLGRPENTAKGRFEGNPRALPQAAGQIGNNGWALNEGFGQLQAAQPAPAPRRPRGRGEDLQVEEMIAPQVQQNQRPSGFGYHAQAVRDDSSGQIVFTSKDVAEEFAAQMASKNPKVLYGVFECAAVFETSDPVVLVKEYNDSGELIVKENGDNV